MHKRNMLAVADGLAAVLASPIKPRHGIGFNMNTYTPEPISVCYSRTDQSPHHCGTVMCLAGWTILLLLGKRHMPKVPSAVEHKAAELLGLTKLQSEALFEPGIKVRNELTLEDAIATLRVTAATGAVQWVRPIAGAARY